jgi:hypothetical protein
MMIKAQQLRLLHPTVLHVMSLARQIQLKTLPSTTRAM